MNAELEAAVNLEVARIEQEMQPEDFLVEIQRYLVPINGEYALPICDAKLREFAQGLLDKVTPALESASPTEAWAIAREARTAFRVKIKAMEPERIAEHRAILAIREPWRTRGHAASKTTMSVPENIVPMVKKIEEIF